MCFSIRGMIAKYLVYGCLASPRFAQNKNFHLIGNRTRTGTRTQARPPHSHSAFQTGDATIKPTRRNDNWFQSPSPAHISKVPTHHTLRLIIIFLLPLSNLIYYHKSPFQRKPNRFNVLAVFRLPVLQKTRYTLNASTKIKIIIFQKNSKTCKIPTLKMQRSWV